jgi:putative transcriptional regulator
VFSKKKYLKLFGSHIRVLRHKKGYTQQHLSHLMNKDTQSLQRVERGVINPSIFYIYELANALEVSPKELLDF